MNPRKAPRAEALSASTVLSDQVARSVRRYLSDHGEFEITDLYELVVSEIESPLLSEVLHYCEGNQSRTAEMLGINRTTLRKKLKTHGLL